MKLSDLNTRDEQFVGNTSNNGKSSNPKDGYPLIPIDKLKQVTIRGDTFLDPDEQEDPEALADAADNANNIGFKQIWTN